MPNNNDFPTTPKTDDVEPRVCPMESLPTISDEDCVPFPDDSHAPKYRPFYFESYGMPSIKASVFERTDVEEEYPFLPKMFELEYRPGSHLRQEPLAKVIIVAQKDFPRLFYPEFSENKPKGAAFVILLSDQFEQFAVTLAEARPNIMNICGADLMHCTSNYSWGADSNGKRLSLRIIENAVERLINPCLARGWNETLIGQFIPVLTVSGNTVACGGFWHDSIFAMENQCASVTALNHNPYQLFSEEELREATERADSRNLELNEEIDEIWGNRIALNPPIFDCTDWFNTTE